MKKAILILISVLSLLGCNPNRPEDILNKYKPAIAQLSSGPLKCTTFHVGEGVFLTSRHCIKEFELNDYVITELGGSQFAAEIVYIDPEEDVAVIRSPHIPDVKLKILDLNQGGVHSGQEIMSMGFPAYAFGDFVFEVGYVQNIKTFDQYTYIISKNISYPGESGGPVVDVKSGYVIGITTAMIERTELLSDNISHQHNTISIILPWNKIQKAIAVALEE